MKDAEDFEEEWNPHEIENIEDFRKQLKQSGHNYWGDYILLNNVIQQKWLRQIWLKQKSWVLKQV